MAKQCDVQTNFLKDLKKIVEKENGIDCVLWLLCPSFTTLKVEYNGNINFKKIKKLIFNEIENNESFKKMVDFGFYKKYIIQKEKNEIHYKWIKKRSQEHPFGGVKIYCNDLLSGYSYASDEAGSTWKRRNFGKWELIKFSNFNELSLFVNSDLKNILQFLMCYFFFLELNKYG